MKHLLGAVFFTIVSPLAAPGLTIAEALNRTLQNNPHVLQARVAVEQASGHRLVFRSLALPNFALDVPVGVQGGSRAGEPAVQPFAFAQGDLRQPLFQAGIPASLRRGDLEVLIAAQQLNVVLVEQLHTARLAFYTALYDRALEELGRSQRQRLDENIRGEEARYQAGTVDRGALASATLQARELDPQIDEAHHAYGAAILQLAAALGESLGAGAKLPSPEGTLHFAAVDFALEKETGSALDRRADLRLARLLVRAAREDQRLTAAGYYPRIDLTVFGRYIPLTNLREASSGSANRSNDIVTSEISPGASYTWRVIDDGSVAGAVLRQRSLREINELQLQKLEASVGRTLAGLQNNFRAIATRHDSLGKSIALAEKNVGAVEQSRQQGLASQLEFRTAETELLATRRGLLDTAYQQNVALAEWDRATGRYFQFTEDSSRRPKE
ncbi:MAG: TolC family protein [Chthoniobacterales bacterium]|nr:TolC family protein [Chthoniobacterales bacterium]